MKKIAFITGVTGQDGSYLAELLLSKNYKTNLAIYNYYLTCKKNPCLLKIYSNEKLIFSSYKNIITC